LFPGTLRAESDTRVWGLLDSNATEKRFTFLQLEKSIELNSKPEITGDSQCYGGQNDKLTMESDDTGLHVVSMEGFEQVLVAKTNLVNDVCDFVNESHGSHC
jgi:hypothetical protein